MFNQKTKNMKLLVFVQSLARWGGCWVSLTIWSWYIKNAPKEKKRLKMHALFDWVWCTDLKCFMRVKTNIFHDCLEVIRLKLNSIMLFQNLTRGFDSFACVQADFRFALQLLHLIIIRVFSAWTRRPKKGAIHPSIQRRPNWNYKKEKQMNRTYNI